MLKPLADFFVLSWSSFLIFFDILLTSFAGGGSGQQQSLGDVGPKTGLHAATSWCNLFEPAGNLHQEALHIFALDVPSNNVDSEPMEHHERCAVLHQKLAGQGNGACSTCCLPLISLCRPPIS